MSHKITQLNSQVSDAQGDFTHSMGDLANVNVTPNDGDLLGFDSSGTPITLDVPDGIDNAGSSWQSATGWGGGSALQTGNLVYWRGTSQTATLDATKVTVSGGTWVSQVTIAAGTYLVSMTYPVRAFAGVSDYIDLRLRDVTNSAYLGPIVRIGNGKSSNLCILPITLTSSTAIGWRIVGKGGNPYLALDWQFQGFQFIITELL